MEKKELRKIGLRNLAWLSEHPSIKQNKEHDLCQQLFQADCWKNANSVAITKSMTTEFSTKALLTRGLASNKSMFMPKVEHEHGMNFYKVDEKTLFERTSFGVEEPIAHDRISTKDLDLIIVPGIIFTLKGYRIGYGGGYYDYFLKDFKGRSCSLVFSEQIQEHWQPESFDKQVEQLFIT